MKITSLSLGAVFFTATPISSMGAVLKSQAKSNAKGFFGDLANGVVGAALGVPPMGMGMPGMVPPASAQAARESESMQSHQRILDKKLEKELEHLEKVKSEVQYMKDEGLLEQGKELHKLEAPATSSVALKALQQGQGSPIGGALEDYEAPIIFLEPPPVSPSQMIQASEVSQADLQRIGDESSPAMKAIKEYEKKKLGRVNANNLEETKQEIRETNAMIKKRKVERESILNKLKEKGRVLAKTGSKRLQEEATFAKNDLKEKDKELEILANKLIILKKKEANLLSMMGSGKKQKETVEEEEEEEEEEDF